MSSIMKVFLLLAVMVCVSTAQLTDNPGQQCLCQRVRNAINSKKDIKDIQIHRATIFCDKVEIVITYNNGLRYCLNPELRAVQKLMASMMKKKASTTAGPTQLTSSPGSTNTARI